METPAVAGASLRFTTVIDFPKEVPVNHVCNLHITSEDYKLKSAFVYKLYIFVVKLPPFNIHVRGFGQLQIRREMARQHLLDVSPGKRLGDVTVHAGLQRSLPIVVKGKGAEGHDGQVLL